ncbi:hypothetical protein Y1Q_0013044 [Alligator mississippiensis]|uniref:Uncharacterized protein n=1 Tax=Alligator mississippiensis TaxID=8496 RepID=A0A151N6T1_ALLMI|nr:hypothetical protein Y1Q_0013044 [Alligator mississippiensis]
MAPVQTSLHGSQDESHSNQIHSRQFCCNSFLIALILQAQAICFGENEAPTVMCPRQLVPLLPFPWFHPQNRQMDIEVVGCVKMALSKLQTYYQKSVVEDGEDVAKAIWHRDMWHGIIEHPPSREGGGDSEEEEGTSRTEDNNSDSRQQQQVLQWELERQ